MLPTLLAVVVAYASPALAAGVFRVDAASTAATPDGQTWATAYPTLQAGVDAASAASGGEVWVKAGVYTATTDPVLTMQPNVSLYGGFAGTESAREERDWALNITLIDGEDSRRCINGAEDSVLDGLTVMRGFADSGGGLYNSFWGDCVVSNCVFSRNTALGHGDMGGGGGGGGMCTCFSTPIVTNCTFIDNVSYGYGGGAFSSDYAFPHFTNCTFTGNEASTYGGGFFAASYMGIPSVRNCIFWDNSAPEGPDVYGEFDYQEFTYTCIPGGYEGVGNIDADPLFVDASNGGSLQLREGSPCIDAGTASDAPSVDIRGVARPQGLGVDMGAYEGGVVAADLVSLALDVTPAGGGRTVPEAGTYLYGRGEIVGLLAQPTGMRLSGWTGAVTGADLFIVVLMDADKAVTANFSPYVVRVDAGNTSGPWDGLTWATAFQDIQTGVDQARNGGGGEVWVAEGVYTATTDPVVTLRPGVWLYGGFAGTETARAERDWEAHVTTVDGQRARRCVRGANDAVLDGFTVTHGMAESGGGMCNVWCSPTVSHCTFVENSAGRGGGVFNEYSSLRLTECLFLRNTSTSTVFSEVGGGGLWASGAGHLVLTDCTFVRNAAVCSGGGIHSRDDCVLELTNCVFIRNESGGDSPGQGGAIANGAPLTATNCVFLGNAANSSLGMGGALHLGDAATILNCTFTGNSAAYGGGGILGFSFASATVTNCVLWGDTASHGPEIYIMDGAVACTCVQGGYTGTGNIDADPLFVGGAGGGSLQLGAGSPCADTGTATGAPATDLLGRERPQGAGVDMGAYEGEVGAGDVVSLTVQVSPSGVGGTFPVEGTHLYARGETASVAAWGLEGMRFGGWSGAAAGMEPYVRVLMDADKTVTALFEASIFYVDADNATGPWDGLTWGTAFRDIQSGLVCAELDGSGGEVWVAEGVYTGVGDTVVTLAPGVPLYGGFAGTESTREERDWARHVCYIDGESVRRCVNGVDDAVLDGFTIARGLADDGGGMYNASSSPTVTHCTFAGNEATNRGGGMCNVSSSSPTVTHCTFLGNSAAGNGGGMCNVSSSSPTVTNCTFLGNSVAGDGGGMSNVSQCSPKVMNCTFAGNDAVSFGGGIYGESSSRARVTNCILWGDTAPNGAEMISSGGSSPVVQYTCVQGGYTGTGNTADDPLFVDSGTGGSVQLRTGSSCIDTGTSTGAPATDILGRARPQGGGVDMGAHEGEVPPGDIVSLTVQANPAGGGRLAPAAGTHLYGRGEIAWAVFVQPLGMHWSHWTGAVTSAAPCVGVVMDADKTVTANFSSNVIFVDKDNVAGPWDGRTWGTAFQDIQSGADLAAADIGGEVWVAEGAYTAVSDPILTMRRGVPLYAGFTGTEAARDERDWTAHIAVIDGENARCCVYGADDALLDGFTLTRGTSEDGGGGMRNNYSSPDVVHCTFSANTFGGMYNASSSPRVTDCMFASNNGGMYNRSSSPLVTRCTFRDNNGSGIHSTSGLKTVTVAQCSFMSNLAREGAGLYTDGPALIVTNCAFSDNDATSGGGIYCEDTAPTVTNCTFVRNAAGEGGAIYSDSCSPALTNCILWGNTAADGPQIAGGDSSWPIVTYTCVQGGYTGGGNIAEDPLLVDDGHGGSLQLRTGSPCVDSGLASGAPAIDILGRPRPQGAGVDMGAYEGETGAADVVTLTLQVSPPGGGRTVPEAGTHCYVRGEAASLTVQPLGMRWSGWTGAITGMARSVVVTMNADKACAATFSTHVVYVDKDNSSGPWNGETWGTAFQDIQSAVDDALDAGGGEVWVAEGAYTATADPVLLMAPGVSIYGGFVGVETVRDERDWKAHTAALDGEDSRRCVKGADDALLDGFTVTRGASPLGGGMYNRSSSPVVANCTFTQNSATAATEWYGGGGMYNVCSSPIVTNCVFAQNTSLPDSHAISGACGGGICNNASSPRLTDCTFTENTTTCLEGAEMSSTGGAIANYCSYPIITRCAFLRNSASNVWYSCGGAVFSTYSSPLMADCTFTENTAVRGGAVYGDVQVTNCTFSHNTASDGGGALYNYALPGMTVVTNCILWNDTAPQGPEVYMSPSLPAVTYSCVQGGWDGTGNIADNPLFVAAPDDLRLQPGSPCFDTGTPVGAPATDIRGTPRPQGAGVDMGAYEGNAYGLYAPPVTGTPSPTLDQTPTWTWTSGGGAGTGVYRYGRAEGVWDAVEVTTTSYTSAVPLPDGTYTLYVQERDAGGHWSASGTYAIAVDTEPPIAIVIQPEGGRIEVGDDFSFMVAATGGYGTLWYQWKKDGEAILGATEPVYTITDAVLGDSGRYAVEISDITGDIVESAPARLTVVPELPAASAADLAALTAALAVVAARRRRRPPRRPTAEK